VGLDVCLPVSGDLPSEIRAGETRAGLARDVPRAALAGVERKVVRNLCRVRGWRSSFPERMVCRCYATHVVRGWCFGQGDGEAATVVRTDRTAAPAFAGKGAGSVTTDPSEQFHRAFWLPCRLDPSGRFVGGFVGLPDPRSAADHCGIDRCGVRCACGFIRPPRPASYRAASGGAAASGVDTAPRVPPKVPARAGH
jgi:hypothetical protein